MSKIKTFTEKKNRTPFDWRKALIEVKQTQRETLANLRLKAGSWVTCACGNQCDIIPRLNSGEPLNYKLSNLGSSFYSDVSMMGTPSINPNLFEVYRNHALRGLEEIETLSFTLINQIIFDKEFKRIAGINPLHNPNWLEIE